MLFNMKRLYTLFITYIFVTLALSHIIVRGSFSSDSLNTESNVGEKKSGGKFIYYQNQDVSMVSLSNIVR